MVNENQKFNFEIILGTYEEYLLGYKIIKDQKKVELKQSFAEHSHNASIRAVDCNDKYLASGGADDRIFIYNMHQRKEYTVLTHHSSTITALSFVPGNSTHLVSASQDGVLTCIRTGNWQIEKEWKNGGGGRGKGINTISIHPTGKLALTLGSDGTLRTWNMLNGSLAYTLKLTNEMKNARLVEWCSNQTNIFSISSMKYLQIWDITKGGCIYKEELESNCTSLSWLSENILLVGQEDGKISIYNSKLELAGEDKQHNNRVKCLKTIRNKYAVSADSTGKIILWKIKKNEKELKKICEKDVQCRIITLTIFDESKASLFNEDSEKIGFVVEEFDDNDQPLPKKKLKYNKK